MNVKRGTLIQILVIGIVVVLLAVLVPVATVLNNQEAARKTESAVKTVKDPFEIATNGDPSFNGIILLGNITAVDPTVPSFKVRFSPAPYGSMSLPVTGQIGYNRLAVDVRVVVGQKETVFKNGSVMPSFDAVVPIDDGQSNAYPFDVYTTLFDISLVDDADPTKHYPVAVAIVGAVQSWTVDLTLADLQQRAGIVVVQSIFRRSWTTKFFSTLVVIIMWALSLGIFTLSVTLVLRDRKVEPPTISVAGSLLFALPALRSSQPGIPSIGTSVDVAGFMWNMLLIAAATTMLVANYIIKYRN
ncbi:hypothetical protein HK105_203540 [Polyrhizophydium stewartii]|uniref:DUF4436 domain-containing protein n=1 Tax=Polyrhizophydium stewartii TaxID=2732419 RepID=A0ABR4NB80_9FUNG|nr:hypothetical protein HK105_004741 [Polyrhizophydium stewartii]